MRKLFFTILIIAFFLDYSFLPMLRFDMAPGANFLLLVLVIILLKRSFTKSVGWIVLGGLLLDYVSVTPIGIYVLAFLLTGIGLEVFQKKLITSTPNAISLLMIFFGSFIVFEGFRLIIIETTQLLGISAEPAMFQIENITTLLVFKILLSFIGVFMFNFVDKFEWLIGEKTIELKIDRKSM